MMNLRRKTQFKDIIKPDTMQLTKLPTIAAGTSFSQGGF